ncbi:DUF5052 family protein [Enterococcus crotali]|uniref:DUF5052 family protein n=1 Tax=Enterococcus crotali TaxID=1453587 RepID=UPI000472C6F0|nr:DUF5052 family protein [Enterococcus crotali]OTP53335.1 hypothetical protein A5881_000232 [Enterococcus termitis]
MKKNNVKRTAIIVFIMCSVLVVLSGCQNIKMFFKGFEENFKGLEMSIQTYDEQSQLVDKIVGKSVKIERDETFDIHEGENEKQGDVIQLTIGKHEMHHVGSSMIISETGLDNIFEDYAKSTDIENFDRGLPFVNSMVNDLKNSFTGKKKVILIRSQNGTPLATYAGEKVSMYQTDVPKSTGLLIDGKYLFIYRCDYTIYDTELLKN